MRKDIFAHHGAERTVFECAGQWVPVSEKRPGDKIGAGELLGEIRDIYTERLCSIFAEADGVVLYQTASLGIAAGTPMIAYAELEKEVLQ